MIRIRHLVKRFRGAPALDGLSLDVAEGSVYALIGPNGAGKTTALKILLNMIEPSAGQAEILGVDSRRIGPAEFARIGYVSENQELPRWMTVEYLLRYLKPFYSLWDDARAAELVAQFELPLDRKLRHLSRGMWMKAALASSLAYRPRLLILDEPFSGLDPLARDELLAGLAEAAGETTILISSHDLAEIESFATHIGYLDQGRLRFSEELACLSQRFREVQVTVAAPAALPAQWPKHWMRPETSSAVVRFVDSRFDPQRTVDEVRRLFGEVRDISATAMPLRSVFLTLARGGGKEG